MGYRTAPRIRAPASWLHDKVVIRGGVGSYYDRGELYTYFSPGYAAGEISGGPFGVSQTPPFVTHQNCPYSASPYGNTSFLYNCYIPICGLAPFSPVDGSQLPYNLANPWGPTRSAPPSNPSAADLVNYLPNAAGIIQGAEPFTLGVYNRKNKLPYSINYTLDIQWQPRNDLAIEVGYVGNVGRHQVVPLPFNQSQIATPTHPDQRASPSPTAIPSSIRIPSFLSASIRTQAARTAPCSRTTRAVTSTSAFPIIGYSSESESYTAAGVSSYNALQVHVEKRLSHNFQAGISYTYSHATDEQSATRPLLQRQQCQ